MKGSIRRQKTNQTTCRVLIINNILTDTDHQTNDKARVATAATPKTRISDAIIASDAPLVAFTTDGLAKEEDKSAALGLGVAIVDGGTVVLMVLVVEFDVDEDNKEDPVEEAVAGRELAEELLPSTAFPQRIPELSVFGGGVV
jgi:hypothetical protein